MFDENYMKMQFARRTDKSMPHDTLVQNMRAFEEFLRQVRAEVWERAYYVGYLDGANDIDKLPVNPYTGITIEEMK